MDPERVNTKEWAFVKLLVTCCICFLFCLIVTIWYTGELVKNIYFIITIAIDTIYLSGYLTSVLVVIFYYCFSIQCYSLWFITLNTTIFIFYEITFYELVLPNRHEYFILIVVFATITLSFMYSTLIISMIQIKFIRLSLNYNPQKTIKKNYKYLFIIIELLSFVICLFGFAHTIKTKNIAPIFINLILISYCISIFYMGFSSTISEQKLTILITLSIQTEWFMCSFLCYYLYSNNHIAAILVGIYIFIVPCFGFALRFW